MSKNDKYAKIHLYVSWVFIITGFLYLVARDIVNKSLFTDDSKLNIYIAFFVVGSILNVIIYFGLKSKFVENDGLIIIFGIIGLFSCSLGKDIFNLGFGGNLFIVFMMMIIGAIKGRRICFILMCWWIPINFLTAFLSYFYYYKNSIQKVYAFITPDFLFYSLFYQFVCFIIILIMGTIYKDLKDKEQENKNLLAELELNYEELSAAQEEIKYQNENLKVANVAFEETNIELGQSNKKLAERVAEFYTLQTISQAIGSILDIDNLLKYVNDVILGVMGTNYSTIMLWDEDLQKLKVHTTNINEMTELIVMNDNINCPFLLNILNGSEPILDNYVDKEKYCFAKGREVNSLICIPIDSKSKKNGLVLIEQKYENAFDKDDLRLLEVIGQQVGMAVENAELYKRMHNLAIKDSLTGIYNRLYFHEKLREEKRNAEENGYELSMAIFDIDFFKRFNDTYGHLFGDKVLKGIAELVQNFIRDTDIFARFGGEEFIILFPRTPMDKAYDKVDKLRQKIAETCIEDDNVSAMVTVSFGISCYPLFASSEDELIRSADDALYAAKNSGRNCVKKAKQTSSLI